MRNFFKVIIPAAFIVVFTSSVLMAGVIDELNYVSEKTDFYSYINFSKIINFISLKGIDIKEIDAMMTDGPESESAKVIKDFGLKMSDVNELLMVMNTQDVEKKSGYLVLISFKNGKGVIPESFKKGSVKLKSGTGYKASADEDVIFTKVEDFFVIGPMQYVDSYLEKRSSKKTILSPGSSFFIKKTAGKSLSFQLTVSEYLKNTMNTAVNSGAGMTRGLKENVFIQTLLSLESLDWGVEISDKIIFQSGMQGSKIEDSERLQMLCHTGIVASSFVVSFADLMAARTGDQKLTELTGDQQLMLWMQKAFGRIHTRQEGKGIVITFEMNSSETDMLISFVKKEIDKETKSRAERIEREKNSKFTQAVTEGNAVLVQKYIKEKYNINGLDTDGNTPLGVAALHGNVEMAKLLVEKGAGLNFPDIDKITPLQQAVKTGSRDMVAFLLGKGCDVNLKSDGDITALHMNAMQGNVEITVLLLSKGALVNALDADSSTPFHHAAASGNIDVVKLLAEKKADPNLLNKSELRAIDMAAQNGHTEVVEFLKLKFKQEPKSNSSEEDYSSDNSEKNDETDSGIESEDPEFEEDIK